MASIQQLPVKTLVKVLADLRGGDIGFDPYRDPRTSKKENLLSFILQNHTNEAIIASITKVNAVSEAASGAAVTTDAVAEAFFADTPTPASNTIANARALWVVSYKDINGRVHEQEFEGLHAADSFIRINPFHQYLSKRLKNETSASAAASPIKFKPEAPVTDASADNRLEVLKQLLAPAIDESKIKAICDARAQEYVDNILEAVNTRLSSYDAKIDNLQFPTTVQFLKAPDAPVVDLGLQHKHFPTLLKMAQARTRDGHKLNIWLKGPAGSGKTTAAKKVAEALAQPFQFNGAISTEYELMGFKDAAGNYHRTAFREIFEHGGVYLFDEVDSSLPKAVLAFNAALANGECRFPDAMVNRHKDCVVLAGANTAGNGATSDYVGRMKQDLAFLNRFVMLDWPLDEALEKSLAANKSWVRKVQKYRENADKRGIKGHIISPRATFYGEALLAAGIEEEIVEQACIRGALSSDQWAQLCQ